MSLCPAMMVLSLWLTAPATDRDDADSLCGPVSVYVALQTLDIPADLAVIQKECAWEPGLGVSFGALVEMVEKHDRIDCQLTNVSYSQLRQFVIEGGVAILPVRIKTDSTLVDHTICIVQATETLEAVEYPKGRTVWDQRSLTEHWNGDALLIRRRFSLAAFAGCVLTAAALLSLIGFAFFRKTKSAPN